MILVVMTYRVTRNVLKRDIGTRVKTGGCVRACWCGTLKQVQELQQYLKDKKIPISGVKKDLVHRVKMHQDSITRQRGGLGEGGDVIELHRWRRELWRRSRRRREGAAALESNHVPAHAKRQRFQKLARYSERRAAQGESWSAPFPPFPAFPLALRPRCPSSWRACVLVFECHVCHFHAWHATRYVSPKP
jgi:hypothetical protein